jgi:Uma2 family endonuclease
MFVAKPEETYLPFEDFLATLDEDTLAEWVDGRIEFMSPASLRHQEIVGFLYRALYDHAHTHDLGKVVMAPFQVKLGPDLPGREPDLLFIARGSLDRVRPTYLDGAPEVVVEVSSPESAALDRGAKFVEYEKAGVREYWLIDPERDEVVVYRLEGGRYRSVETDAEGLIASQAIPSFAFAPRWLLREPPGRDG